MNEATYIDLLALIPPIAGLGLLFKKQVPVTGVRAGTVARLNLAFLAATVFDAVRVQGFAWAVYGMFVGLWLIFNAIGTLGFNLVYPETHTIRQVVAKGARNPEFQIYHLTVLGWLIINILLPAYYLSSTLVLMALLLIHPTRLFWLAKRKTNPAGTRDMLTILQVSWFSFVAIAFILFSLGTTPPVLGVSLPFAWQLAFLSSSTFFLFMSIAVTSPSGLTKSWTSMLVPDTLVKLGQKYLILHDSGEKARVLLSTSFKNCVEAGARIIITNIIYSPFLERTLQSDRLFKTWEKQGKLVAMTQDQESHETREKALGKLGLGNPSLVYVTVLQDVDLDKTPKARELGKTLQKSSELFLVENSKVSRSRVTEFLKNNQDIELLDISTPTSPFAAMLNLPHSKLQGSTILLEFGSDANIEETVRRFLLEGHSNAELCAVFTSKSSRLYRAIKGTKNVKIVAASSLVSGPDELPDGEVQIPDRELGLVTSIASDFLEAKKELPACLVFDSVTELIRGDRWEQIYSGVKQIVELVTLPNVTTLFLTNRDTTDAHFLGAMRAAFPVLMRLDRAGLQATKLAA